MKAFMVISTGDSATSTVPILATSNAEVIAAAMDALLDRIVPADEPDAPAPQATP